MRKYTPPKNLKGSLLDLAITAKNISKYFYFKKIGNNCLIACCPFLGKKLGFLHFLKINNYPYRSIS
ncbi:MAG: hypothetical protein R3Y52_00345 [Psittacicella sp.]